MLCVLKPFHLMTSEDYYALGLRVGLEIHRQLNTRTKLFCRCPAGRYSNEYDAEILRHMRPTLSELGEYDGTALMEKKTRKNIYYRIHRDTVCTYEFDDTPPFFIAEDALDAALGVALLLRLNRVSELHIARKQYLDGSIPTGFQRTTILGIDGWIPFRKRRIGIRQLGLEEDSCREVSDVGHDRFYLTDRLGTPLIELVTEPDMRTPQEAADVAQVLRRLCKSTGNVRTGYGTARQDVNVSISGGTRIEIKGVPQIWRIPNLVYSEARRQHSLLQIRDELKRRGVSAETLGHRAVDVTGVVAKTHYEPMRAALKRGLCVKCVVLERFAGLLNKQTQEHTSFAKEFSDRIRVIACLTRLPNMIHSDAASESLYGQDWQKLRRKMKAGDDDVLLLVWGTAEDAETACREIAIRAREATVGVPSDTRQALRDGTNGFERVLPGAERMYPDTDLPPVAISEERVERVRDHIPEFIWDREERFRKIGVPEDSVERLSFSPRVGLFSRLLDELGVDPALGAVVLDQRMRALRREGLDTDLLSDDDIYEVFEVYASGALGREIIVSILRLVLRDRGKCELESAGVADVFARLDLRPVDDDELTERVCAAVNEAENRSFSSTAKRRRFVMGRLMAEFGGRADGRRVARQVETELGSDRDREPSVEVSA